MKGKIDLFDFYINSSVHVALAVVSLALITYLELDVRIDWPLIFFIFFGSITGYNFVKYAGIAKLHHQSLARSLQKIQIFSLICFISLIFTAFLVAFEVLLWSGLFAALTLLYAVPVFSRSRNLRSVAGIKIFVIAVVWAGVTVILPLREVNYSLNTEILIEMLQRFLLVLAWILPFEIRDLKHDLTELGTIPQKIGVTKTKIFGFALVGTAVVLELLQDAPLPGAIAFLLTGFISIGFIWKAAEKQSFYYSSFWVESIPIFWLFILLLLLKI